MISESPTKQTSKHGLNIKGTLKDFSDGNLFSNFTLDVGEGKTEVNVCCTNDFMEKNVRKYYKLGEKVRVFFYLSSKKKGDKFETTANAVYIKRWVDLPKEESTQ